MYEGQILTVPFTYVASVLQCHFDICSGCVKNVGSVASTSQDFVVLLKPAVLDIF